MFKGAALRRLGYVCLAWLTTFTFLSCAVDPAPDASKSGAVSETSDELGADEENTAWSQWRPGKELPRAEMSDEQRDVLYRQQLESILRIAEIENPPQVEVSRWIYPEEQGRVWSGCMQEQGFDSQETAGGQILSDMGDESQELAFWTANYVCIARFPIDPRTDFHYWNEAQLKAWYQYLVEFLVPCLDQLEANPDTAPSWEVFLADPESWEYPDAGGQNQEAWYAQCPHSPPSAVILGDG
jgi:hypothetical protein